MSKHRWGERKGGRVVVAGRTALTPPPLSSSSSPPPLQYGLESLRQQGVPVDGLSFDSQLVIRGLIMDKEKGNLIKVDRFG